MLLKDKQIIFRDSLQDNIQDNPGFGQGLGWEIAGLGYPRYVYWDARDIGARGR